MNEKQNPLGEMISFILLLLLSTDDPSELLRNHLGGTFRERDRVNNTQYDEFEKLFEAFEMNLLDSYPLRVHFFCIRL